MLLHAADGRARHCPCLMLAPLAPCSRRDGRRTRTRGTDCTATASFQVYASESGALVRKTVFSFVFVDNLTEFFAVEQSLKALDGTVVPAVITVNGKRLFSEG